MKKVMIGSLVAMTLALSGCINIPAPQPDRMVSSHIMSGIKFERSDGKVDTAQRFLTQIVVVNKDLDEARRNLRAEGMNLCWKTSSGRFFVIGDERLAIESDKTSLVWKIACDPVNYFANRADNNKVYNSKYLMENRPSRLK